MRFSRWQAAGNEYLLVERAELGEPMTPERVRAEVGGSDGILEVVSAEGGEAEIVIWNPDGSVAEMSGNGTRIAARWLAERSGEDEVVVRVGPRDVAARLLAGRRNRAGHGRRSRSTSRSGSPGSRSLRSRSETRTRSSSATPAISR